MSNPPSPLFGRRLRTARKRLRLPQDQLGVLIGLDEGSSNTRISRYETGIHEPPFATAEKLAEVLNVPVAYFYCPDELLARLLLSAHRLPESKREEALAFVERLATE